MALDKATTEAIVKKYVKKIIAAMSGVKGAKPVESQGLQELEKRCAQRQAGREDVQRHEVDAWLGRKMHSARPS